MSNNMNKSQIYWSTRLQHAIDQKYHQDRIKKMRAEMRGDLTVAEIQEVDAFIEYVKQDFNPNN